MLSLASIVRVLPGSVKTQGTKNPAFCRGLASVAALWCGWHLGREL